MNPALRELSTVVMEASYAVQKASRHLNEFSHEVGFYDPFDADIFYNLLLSLNTAHGMFANVIYTGIPKKMYFVNELENSAEARSKDEQICRLKEEIALLKQNVGNTDLIKYSELENDFKTKLTEKDEEIKSKLTEKDEEIKSKLTEKDEEIKSKLTEKDEEIKTLIERLAAMEEKNEEKIKSFELNQAENEETAMKLFLECECLKEKLHETEEQLSNVKENLNLAKKQIIYNKFIATGDNSTKDSQLTKRTLSVVKDVTTNTSTKEKEVDNSAMNRVLNKVQSSYSEKFAELKNADDSKFSINSDEVAMPPPMIVISSKKSVKKVAKKIKRERLINMTKEELYEMDWRSIHEENAFMTKFEQREGMISDVAEGMKEDDITILWKDPNVYRGDDGPYDFHGMFAASNGYFYEWDEENKRYYLAVRGGKFQMWNINK